MVQCYGYQILPYYLWQLNGLQNFRWFALYFFKINMLCHHLPAISNTCKCKWKWKDYCHYSLNFECVSNTNFFFKLYIYAKKLEWCNLGCKMFSIWCFMWFVNKFKGFVLNFVLLLNKCIPYDWAELYNFSTCDFFFLFWFGNRII